MTTANGAERIIRLPRGVKLRYNAVRQQWFLLGPERVFEPDEVAVEILQRIDGSRSIEAITAELATAFDAPTDEIGRDVNTFVNHLIEIRMLEPVVDKL
jgi:pyrroloquinoline quinone biosynthesis protein D